MALRIALYQGPGRPRDVAGNLETMRTKALEAAHLGTRLLVLPELFLSGYNVGDEVFRLAEPADGPAAQEAAGIARQAGVALVYGYPERAGQAVYNAALLLGPQGEALANARKLHLYGADEKRLFRPGERFAAAEIDGLRLGLLICYDIEFPEAARALALAGADAIVVPTALFRPHDAVAGRVVPVRAYENQIFVAYANRSGREGELAYCGGSCVVAPDGADLCRAGSEETLLRATIDPPAYAASRRANPYLADRRPELYAAAAGGAGT